MMGLKITLVSDKNPWAYGTHIVSGYIWCTTATHIRPLLIMDSIPRGLVHAICNGTSLDLYFYLRCCLAQYIDSAMSASWCHVCIQNEDSICLLKIHKPEAMKGGKSILNREVCMFNDWRSLYNGLQIIPHLISRMKFFSTSCYV